MDRRKLVELLAGIAANHACYAVILDTVEVALVRTRDGCAAVFLGSLRASESNPALHALYAELVASPAPVRRGNHAALETVAFALRVSDIRKFITAASMTQSWCASNYPSQRATISCVSHL